MTDQSTGHAGEPWPWPYYTPPTPMWPIAPPPPITNMIQSPGLENDQVFLRFARVMAMSGILANTKLVKSLEIDEGRDFTITEYAKDADRIARALLDVEKKDKEAPDDKA